MLRRLEYFCEACDTPFTVWWTSNKDPSRVCCPICTNQSPKFEGQHEFRSAKQKRGFTDAARHMLSKFDGKCVVCGKPIKANEPIVYEGGVGAAHEGCVK
jgi:hypothetical protein